MKKVRQEKILEIIKRQEVETQEELAELLRAEGFAVTQATVSRDIRELALNKVPGSKARQRYRQGLGDSVGSQGLGKQYTGVLSDGLVSMEQAGNLLVIKTVSGMAMAVAAAVDALHLEGIVGSIAGDDTILCAIKTEEQVKKVMASLQTTIDSMSMSN